MERIARLRKPSTLMSTDQRELLTDIVAMVRQHVPGSATHTIEADTNLFDLGLDSMALISLIVALEERFGWTLDIDHLQPERFRTVAGIAALLPSKTG